MLDMGPRLPYIGRSMSDSEPTALFLSPAEIEAWARDLGRSMASVLRAADFPEALFRRWKRGQTAPKLDSYARLVAALERDGRTS